jgi:arabinogalactan oligomer / maltooligosaccharide transport system permease protein
MTTLEARAPVTTLAELEPLRRRARRRRIAILTLKRIAIVLVILLTLAPGYWIVLASLAPGDAFFGVSLIPEDVTFGNYADLIADTDFLTWVKNSLIVSTSVAALSTLATALAAYAFSRLRFWGRRYGLMVMLLVQMFPIGVALPAYFYLLLWLGDHFSPGGRTIVGLNTLQGVILVLAGGGVAFYAWLFKGYLDNMPIELEEAAFVDGATRLQTLRYVLFPLVRPIIAVVFLFLFIGTYSEYLLTSLVIFDDPSKNTLPLGLNGFIFNQFAQHWTQFAAAAVVGSIPLMVVFMLMQRYLVAGLARGAVKG